MLVLQPHVLGRDAESPDPALRHLLRPHLEQTSVQCISFADLKVYSVTVTLLESFSNHIESLLDDVNQAYR